MLHHGFWLFEFVSISQQILQSPKKYYRAFIHKEADSNDLNYFILHQLGMVQQAIEKLHEYIRRKSDELAEMRGLLDNRSSFNHRQLALLRYALKHQTATFTVASHQRSHNVVPQIARTDLEMLVGIGLLKKAKVGKGFLYIPVVGFSDRLKELPNAFD